MNDADALHFDEQQFYRERDAEAARAKKRITFPNVNPTVGAMIPALNRARVFGISARKGFAEGVTFPVARFDSEDARKGNIKYRGPHLTQFHKRVLLGLMQLAAGKTGDAIVTFNAKEFLTANGRSDDWRTVVKLRSALADLRSATFTVNKYDGDRGAVFGWLIDAEWMGNEVEVRLDRKAAIALDELRPTYLPLAKRSMLVDGLQTWLLDLIFASSQEDYSYDALAEILGREDVAGFGKEARAALKLIAAVGAIDEPEYRRGRFTARRRSIE